MRALLISIAVMPLLIGCETAWGGSTSDSLQNLEAKQMAQIQKEEESGQISSDKADAERKSIQQRTSRVKSNISESSATAGNPAGEQNVQNY